MRKLGTFSPVNRTAALVVSDGVHFEYPIEQCSSDSDLPLPVGRIPQSCLSVSGFTDFTGKEFGRLRVIGYSAGGRSMWVCRCACGTYTLRKGRALSRKPESVPPCDQCYLLGASKRDEFQRRTGKRVSVREFLK